MLDKTNKQTKHSDQTTLLKSNYLQIQFMVRLLYFSYIPTLTLSCFNAKELMGFL